jgi:hypothetical protein
MLGLFRHTKTIVLWCERNPSTRIKLNTLLKSSVYESLPKYPTVRVTLQLTVSQSVCLDVEPTCGRLTRYCFLFKSLGLEFVVPSLWGALSDERRGLSFVSHSLVICLCVHLLLIFLFHTFTIYILYNTCNIDKASFCPGLVQQIMPYYSLVAHTTTAV